MENEIKIAYFGICFDVYTQSYIYNLKKQMPGLIVDYFNYDGQGEDFERNPHYFDNIVQLPTPLLSKKKFNPFKSILNSLLVFYKFLNPDFIYFTYKCLTRSILLSEYRTYLSSYINDVYRVRFIKNKLVGYDVVHLNGVCHTFCAFLSNLDRDKKLICSFWGSDLWWGSGIVNHIQIQNILKRADVVTVFTEEMKELFISKFGRDYAPKTSIMLFGMNEEIKNYILCNEKRKSKELFCNKYNIDVNDTLICLSNNGARHRIQHDLLIELIMSNISRDIAANIVFVIPFGYGSKNRDSDYEIIEESLRRFKCKYVFIERYLSNNEVGELRQAIDIYLQTPLTDSFSMALIESILAGSICITGAWLPYRTIKKSGVHLFEVNSIEEIPRLLVDIISRPQLAKEEISHNSSNVKPIAFWDYTIKDWAGLISSLLS